MDKKQKSIDEILKSYYFVKQSSEEDCVSTIKAEIRELIPDKMVLSMRKDDYGADILKNGFNTAIDLMNKIYD